MSRLTHGSAKLTRALTRLAREIALLLVSLNERVSRFRTIAAFAVFRWRAWQFGEPHD